MSGTSLDGIDLAFVNFKFNGTWSFKIEQSQTVPYDLEWKSELAEAINYSDLDLEFLNIRYTKYLATVINNFISNYNIKNIDAICSHGHTIKHEPQNNYTLQIGNLKTITNYLNHTVVCDFRVQDVNLGGQGAPLVPIGDHVLFEDYDYCLNLGGFSNVSLLENSIRIAFDISPVNIVLNHYVSNLGLDFDDKGQIAKSGLVNQDLLNSLNDLEYYKQSPPKSLGLEWVRAHVFSLIDRSFNAVSEADVLRTLVEHIAYQISRVIPENKSVLVTGGGAYNTFLIERCKAYSTSDFIIPNRNIIEFKEALIFGFLGVLKLQNEINVLKSVTGASKNHSSGVVYRKK